ncbi:MAG: endonuclease MutS2 [Treponema sp.]|jgi:DNA mismatch repair protein MutS2|nr:endonuclease MutS2 [Treponema sp.]
MNEKTLKLLEFDTIRQRVASCALSEEAAALILSDNCKRDKTETEKLKQLVSVILLHMNSTDVEKREELPPVSAILPRLGVDGTVLEIEEFYALGIFIRRAEDLKNWLIKACAGCGGNGEALLAPLLHVLPPCTFMETEIFRVIDNEGRLRDLSEFRDIRRRIASISKELENAGSRYSGSEETRRMLQSSVPSLRDGRLVLAVKANFRSRIKGIVHEVSASGQTVFIEPEEIVEKNNDLLIEKRRLDAQIRRVLRELTGRICEGRDDLAVFHSGIVFLESIRARARYGFETRGIFASEDSQGTLILKKARHPLLGSNAVPLDFTMSGNIRTVIITGPNTGGKTVALKTAGLLAMMNQFGLALPLEEGSCLPVFDGIYADIGDEQSISQSLSTFSSHMTNIAAIVREAGGQSLVLLDELGSGTDPEEGSAIAMAILDHLIEKRARLIVTTHHSILKNYGYTREGAENASMEFDGQTLSPTFRIVMGIPGESRALDIAARNGLSPGIVTGARAYLADEQADVSALITGLREKRRELDEAEKAGRAEETALKEARRKADLKELRLRQKELQLKTEGAGNLRRLMEESRKQLENLVRELKEGEVTREKTLKVKDFIAELEDSVRAGNEELTREEGLIVEEHRRLEEEVSGGSAGNKKENAGYSIQLGPGVEVLVGETRRPGRIVRQDKKREASWVVETGPLKMNYSEKELIPLALSKEKKAHPQAKTGWEADLASSAVCLELNLIGMRMEDALTALRRQIDGAVLSGLKGFSVVHGKGDGILQKGVRDYLKAEKAVADYYFSRPEFGGFGRTEVVLK